MKQEVLLDLFWQINIASEGLKWWDGQKTNKQTKKKQAKYKTSELSFDWAVTRKKQL